MDTNSITGSNLRNILLMTDKTTIEELVPDDLSSLKYQPMPEDEMWKLSILQEIIDTKHGNMEISEFRHNELEGMLDYLCKS